MQSIGEKAQQNGRGRLFIFFLLFCCYTLSPLCANAENWKPFMPEDKSAGQVVQYDLDSKKKVSEAIQRVWIRSEAKEQTGKKGVSPVARAYYLIETNCQERLYRILSTAEYAKDGRLLGSSNADDAPWHHIVPESTVSHLHKAICSK